MPAGLLEALSIGGDGDRVTAGTGVIHTPIPSLYDGSQPRFVVLGNESSTWAFAAAIPSMGSGTPAFATMVTVPVRGIPLIMNVAGYTHITHATWASTAVLNITPLANQ